MSLNMFRGTGEAWFLPSIADGIQGGGPTVAEKTAGIPLGAGFNQIAGLEPQQNQINTPVLRSKTELQIDGPETFQQVVLTVVEDDGTGVDAESLERKAILTGMEAGAEGWLVLARYTQAPIAGAVLFFIHVKVAAQVPNWDLGASAETTAINLTPTTPLYKGTLQAT
jgi:hypothetical protein